jgi:hypothetical protein
MGTARRKRMTLPLGERLREQAEYILGDRIRGNDFRKRHSLRIEWHGHAKAQGVAVALLPTFQMPRKGPASVLVFPGLRPEGPKIGAGRAALPFSN